MKNKVFIKKIICYYLIAQRKKEISIPVIYISKSLASKLNLLHTLRYKTCIFTPF